MLGRFTFIVLAALLAGTAVDAPAAPSLVTGLSLTHEGEYTIVSIQGDGPVRVSHQSVVAKEGKPFRIVVDCLAARHGLAQKEYASLPSSVVTALRTSQYAAKPEEVVRVVIDLARETVYRVETSGSVAKIFVSDPQTAVFSAWSSSPEAGSGTTVVASTTPSPAVATPAAKPVATTKTPSVVAQKSADQAVVPKTPPAAAATQPTAYAAKATTSNDQAKKSATEVAVAKSPTSSTPAPPAKAPVQSEQVKQDAAETAIAKNATPSAPAVAAMTPSAAEKTQAAPAPSKSLPPTVMADLAKKTNDVAWLFGAAEENSNAVPTPGDDPGVPAEDIHKAAIGTALKPSATDNPSTPPAPAQKDVPAVKPAADDAGEALASLEPNTVEAPSPLDDDSAVDDEVSSADLLPAVDQPSKYRRDAARSTVLKQTQVVEFPKRFVTTYEAGDDRDPFETLVDETKPSRGSIENRMANVETLLLVGLLESEAGKTAALLEDLDGIGYILKPGDPVKNGYVSQIDNNAVYFQVNEYGWSRTIVKELDKENSTKQ